ncbi:MAG: nickel-dependent hydrogenase large subunit [Candidatus Lokiarchaeota archaeon]|nr:nickel-dependent hydrogenase large subunit [Candidatus Lokiarchaeota archaeon]
MDVCTRVEGHGTVKILVQNDEISNVNFEIGSNRGFESFLIGKKLTDIPKIVSRICGLCYASQTIASCKAIENLFEIAVPEQSILLRYLLLFGELIKSHSMHFFFQSLPDLFQIFKVSQKQFSPYELIRYDSQLTTNVYELIKIGNEIERIFGGRSVHLITPTPGGIIYLPARKNISLARKYFQKAIIILEWIIEKFIDVFSNLAPPKEYDLPNVMYMGLNNFGNFDRYRGTLKIKENERNSIEFEEKNYSSYFEKDINLRGIDFHFDKSKRFLVGPISRYKITENYEFDKINTYLEYFDKSWQKNILFANFVRLLEMYFEAQQGLKILEEPVLNRRTMLPSLISLKNSEGIGVIEAPRGMLLHHYYVNDNNLIKKAKIFIPTEINIPIINDIITKYAQELYNRTGDLNLVKKKIQTVIRAFDPCLSCVAH